MSEPGFWTMSDAKLPAMRSYFSKGGFVIFDDFRGDHWSNFEQQMRRVIPDGRLIELDASNPIFHSFFDINSPTSCSYYGRGSGDVPRRVRRQRPEEASPAGGQLQPRLGELWEFSDTGFVPVDLSNDAYKFGVNYVDLCDDALIGG